MVSAEKIPKKFSEYIFVKNNFFYVKKISKNGTKTFGKFSSLREACAATSILLKNKWKIRDVSSNPLVTYDNEFWVFNVVDDKLVFDCKFTDFEEAVEHVEINLRCNDYHNDIFKGTSKKNGHKNRFKFQNDEIVTSDEYVFEKSGKFIVKKSNRSNSKCYGEFDNFDDALAAKKLLLDCNWRVKEGNEILFYNDQYWLFESIEGILSFKGKTKSYEDALDLINPQNNQEDSDDFTNPFLKSIEDNFDRVMGKRKPKSYNRGGVFTKSKSKYHNNGKSIKNRMSKPSKKKLSFEDIVKQDLKIKTSVDINKIWNPQFESYKFDNGHFRVFVERCGENTDDLFSIIDFNFFTNNLQCIVDGNEIEWDNRNNIEIPNFPEFPLIANVLEVNNWDLSKIDKSSSIYFYRDAYYKIHVVDEKLVFGKFISYGAAENTLLIYNNSPIAPKNANSLGIDRVGNYYEFVKFQKGEVYKISRLKSLEEIKAIRDILMHANWDFRIFKKYDLFFINGFYWELFYNNHEVFLIGKYELIKTL